MAQIIELNEWRERKVAQVALAPALVCPTCEAECKAVITMDDGSTVYRCAGHGHQPPLPEAQLEPQRRGGGCALERERAVAIL